MLMQGRDVFVWIPDTQAESKDRVLIQGLIVECDSESFVAQFDEPLAVEVGANAFVHAQVNRHFLQQAVVVQAMLPCQEGQKPLVAFTRTGEPISAESRESLRVSVGTTRIPARVAGDGMCQLVDVSATGFGILSASDFHVGDTLEVELEYREIACAGKARVQNVTKAGSRMKRYGFHAVEAPRGHGQNGLQAGLGLIAAAIQKDQLRRLAGA